MSGNNSIKKYIQGSRAGFTLVEMLVVLSLFSVLVIVLVNIFILSLNSQRQVADRQSTTSSLRYIMETMARQIRVSEIDYAGFYSGGAIGSQPQLHLIDQNGNKYGYYITGGELQEDFLPVGGTNQVSPLTKLSDVAIVKLLFYIDPPTNPFADERCNAALTPNGCQPTAFCTINDPNNSAVGYCTCTANNQCATQNCDTSRGVCAPFNRQPRVTIVIGFQSAGVKPEDQKTIYLQTTASSRVYKR